MIKRSIPTPAMVVACLALFVAMGGTGYAATQLSTGHSRATASKTKVKRGPRGKRGPAGPAGEKGATGSQGPQGPKGDRGPSNGYTTNVDNILEFTGGEQVVSSISLPAGAYVLTGYTNVNNNAATQKSVSCKITLNGKEIGATDTVNLGPNTELDRQVLTVTAGGTLASSGVAALSCTPTTDEGNFLGRGLSAIQVASLNG